MILQQILEALFFFDAHHVSVVEFLVAALIPAALALALVAASGQWKRSPVLVTYATFSSLMMVIFPDPTPRAIVLVGILHLVRRRSWPGLCAVLLGVGCGTKYYLATAFCVLLLGNLIWIQKTGREKLQRHLASS